MAARATPRRADPMHYGLVMPAAGSGRRFGAGTPKQYAPLAGSTVLECALAPFLADARCRVIRLVLAAQDPQRTRLAARLGGRGAVVDGGAERSDSVRLGLASLAQVLGPDAWVLVHDAARPCVAAADIDRLIAAVDGSGEAGGLLAAPLADTLKRADADGRCELTAPRAALWCAQTPQMFRVGMLAAALESARLTGRTPTDEAQAMEWTDVRARLVPSMHANPKVTAPADLELAGALLAARGCGGG
ncbi:MAG: 2-C-methyl-D-erythritol 4-phosphate cytidylyltransferase [Gammaproteobacteria bacterium]|nr:2-C-methyl-D-erythritol 4-phosphate cytidylyltransferase [Gammaproteobacteria bacterium]